jgi:hypothetical protein
MSESPTAPETVQDELEAAPSAPEPVEPEGTSAPQEPADPFGEGFDPAQLPPELHSEWKSLKGNFTQKTQELAQQRQAWEQKDQALQALSSNDPELRAWGAQVLGLELAQDEEPEQEDWSDPTEQLAAQVAELQRAFQTQQQEAQTLAQQEAFNNHLIDQVIGMEQRFQREFDPAEMEALMPLAHALGDADKAYELLSGAYSARNGAHVKTKTASPAPRARSAEPTVDLNNTKIRRAELAREIEAGMERGGGDS